MSRAAHHRDTLRVAATTDNLHVVRDFVRLRIGELGFSDFEENGIILAVDEACSNLIRHAYHNDPSQTIEIAVTIRQDSVSVNIADTAEAFDPCNAALPDMTDYLQERRHGGLGILIMTRVMDDIAYVPADERCHQNMLILTKRRTA